MQENNLLTIQKVSALLNVPKPTLRFWEKELDGVFVPFRTNGGQRRYSVETISVIDLLRQCASTAREIKRLREKGMSLPGIKRKLGKGQMSEAGLQPIGAYAPVGSQTCPPSRATLNILYPFVDSFSRGGRGSGDE